MSNSIAKQLKISYYPQLDNMDMADVSNFLELNEEKHHIGCRNWVDKYHFQPLAAFTIAYSDKYIYVDYHTPMKDEQNGLPANLSKDACHPTLEGYKIMEKVLLDALKIK